jgi:hypothetical protein
VERVLLCSRTLSTPPACCPPSGTKSAVGNHNYTTGPAARTNRTSLGRRAGFGQPFNSSLQVGEGDTSFSKYHLHSNALGNNITVAFVRSHNPSALHKRPPQDSPLSGACTATFKRTAGYAFDLAPPDGPTTCPANANPVVVKRGRTFCAFCAPGNYMSNTTHTCDRCPPGTYQDTVGATACKPCPAGFYCPQAECKEPLPCEGGHHTTEVGSTQCSACPANTYAPPGSTSCTPCPKFSESAEGSRACRMPFP